MLSGRNDAELGRKVPAFSVWVKVGVGAADPPGVRVKYGVTEGPQTFEDPWFDVLMISWRTS